MCPEEKRGKCELDTVVVVVELVVVVMKSSQLKSEMAAQVFNDTQEQKETHTLAQTNRHDDTDIHGTDE